jgi:hypothetical protein
LRKIGGRALKEDKKREREKIKRLSTWLEQKSKTLAVGNKLQSGNNHCV